ncbi:MULTISPECIES: SsrA-binding protein SmpB [Kocuria]|uniref:SsrA-binding protein SmpB n=1 Tax=Kocuria TaxID=57493 RepID=UPI00065FE8CC|nr:MULTISPECIES: SsrA-binding protein SmpB [Kocuria]MCT1367555.1 SsrA-binding protein SmpB [Rothia sp. p3-SID1597]RUQ22354.1 SsrA-binding protein SmpB [Kocuria sp. HSID16901]
MAQKNKKSTKNEDGRKVIATNRKARHDYNLLSTYEAGIALLGTEVKSLRDGGASIVDGFCQMTRGELYLENIHIAEYGHGSWTNHEARRRRKLLLHRMELRKLEQKTKETGYTIVPIQLYFRDGKAKVEIALAQGKREYDKRHALKEAQDKREAQRAMRYRNLG